MCGVCVRSILLLPLVSRCIETIYVWIWRMFVCSDCVGVCGNACCVAAVVRDCGYLITIIIIYLKSNIQCI